MVDWHTKLAALLHDPANKPFDIRRHVARADAAFLAATGRAITSAENQIAKDADHWASAADRVNFPVGLLADFRQSPALTHPLSGRRKLDLFNLRTVDTGNLPANVIGKLCAGVIDPRLKFMRLWRGLTDTLEIDVPDIGALWGLLPADTRQPDHALQQHLTMTAALAGAGQQPAFLVFSVGPVQDFIAAARRTQDLWMGSYLLAYLVWAGLKPIVEQFGPDAVVSPSLLDQPLVDVWLAAQGTAQQPDKEQLAIANLPNKFTALLPASEAERVAREAEQAVRAEWQRIADKVRQYLEGLVAVTPAWREIWDRQVASLPEVYWSMLPWPATPDESLKQYVDLLGEPVHFQKVYELFKKHRSVDGGQYNVNLGTTYQLLFDLAERGFAARKGLRDFRQSDECGEQCSVMPGYAALHTGDLTRNGVRKYWEAVAAALEAKKEFAVIKPKGAERLSAIAVIKRFAAQVVFKPELGVNERFPSITSLTAFPFYEDLADKLPHVPELDSAVRFLTSALQAAHVPQTINYESLPRHVRHAIGALDKQATVLRELVKYDGEWLYPETYDQIEFEPGIDKTAMPDVKKQLKELLKATAKQGIAAPARYYAILHMDGDAMGKWMSGTHDQMPTFAALLHPDIEADLKQRAEWRDLLTQKRLVSPAYHAAISHALGNFALKCVRRIVEELHPGVLVYAGGDDVLALLPLEHALPVALELRAAFSGQAIIDEAGVSRVDFLTDAHSGFMAFDGKPLLTMGAAATASTGIAIAHHSGPLSGVLAAAREAEHSAKHQYDRNALAVTVLKRSGEIMRVGAHWHYDQAVPSTVKLIADLQQAMRADAISTKFTHAYFDEARTLAGLPAEAQAAELYRLLKRHKGEAVKSEDAEAQAKEWSARLAPLAKHLQGHRDKLPKTQHRTLADEDLLPQAGMVELGKWLLLARFLNRGGEE